MTRTARNAWCERVPAGWIGRWQVPFFLKVGFRELVASAKTFVIRELVMADWLYCFLATAGHLAEAGVVGREDATRWSDGLRAVDGEGRSFSSYAGFLVHEFRPGG